MKNILAIFLSLTTLSSCSESFRTVDPTAFNKQIADSTNIDTPGELVTLYYNSPPGEASHITCETVALGDRKYEVTLIDDHLEDDAMAAIKIVMTATRSGNHWTVQEIRWSCKCWDGYGHTNWGMGSC